MWGINVEYQCGVSMWGINVGYQCGVINQRKYLESLKLSRNSLQPIVRAKYGPVHAIFFAKDPFLNHISGQCIRIFLYLLFSLVCVSSLSADCLGAFTVLKMVASCTITQRSWDCEKGFCCGKAT